MTKDHHHHHPDVSFLMNLFNFGSKGILSVRQPLRRSACLSVGVTETWNQERKITKCSKNTQIYFKENACVII